VGDGEILGGNKPSKCETKNFTRRFPFSSLLGVAGNLFELKLYVESPDIRDRDPKPATIFATICIGELFTYSCVN
jgi:hypothetical protein